MTELLLYRDVWFLSIIYAVCNATLYQNVLSLDGITLSVIIIFNNCEILID